MTWIKNGVRGISVLAGLSAIILLSVYLSVQDHLHVQSYRFRAAQGDELHSSQTTVAHQKMYLVNSEKCKIISLDPFDPSIKQYFTFPKKREMICPTKWTLTFVKNNRIFMNETVEKQSYKNTIKSCVADDIIRVNISDGKLEYKNRRVIGNAGVELVAEFTRVSCLNRTSKTPTYVNVYAHSIRKNEADRRFKERLPKHRKNVDEVYNVLLIGIDTTSRMNFKRYMMKTEKYLKHKLNAVEYVGYDVIGENTFPNIVALLSGKFIRDLPWNSSIKDKTFDRFSFLFNEYEDAGFTTLLAEDDPSITTFNYVKQGFVKQPTDYYLRPMALTMEVFKERRWRGHNCFFERTEQAIVLDYIHKFVRARRADRMPYFGFSLLNRMTHDSMTNAVYLDAIHVPFLENLVRDGGLANTVLVYYSDHGFRYGRYRATQSGALEHRLPMLYIAPPASFTRKYPQLWKNLRDNARKLTSPFDLYATLHDLLHFKCNKTTWNHGKNQHGASLIRKLPDRSCQEAGIPYHWCACPKKVSLSVQLPDVISAATFLVDHLNLLTAKHKHVCAQLSLANVTDAAEVYDLNKKCYKITVETVPGNAIIEGSVEVKKDGRFATTGEISRMSYYGKTSWCVNDSFIRRICYCKVQKFSTVNPTH